MVHLNLSEFTFQILFDLPSFLQVMLAQFLKTFLGLVEAPRALWGQLVGLMEQ